MPLAAFSKNGLSMEEWSCRSNEFTRWPCPFGQGDCTFDARCVNQSCSLRNLKFGMKKQSKTDWTWVTLRWWNFGRRVHVPFWNKILIFSFCSKANIIKEDSNVAYGVHSFVAWLTSISQFPLSNRPLVDIKVSVLWIRWSHPQSDIDSGKTNPVS